MVMLMRHDSSRDVFVYTAYAREGGAPRPGVARRREPRRLARRVIQDSTLPRASCICIRCTHTEVVTEVQLYYVTTLYVVARYVRFDFGTLSTALNAREKSQVFERSLVVYTTVYTTLSSND